MATKSVIAATDYVIAASDYIISAGDFIISGTDHKNVGHSDDFVLARKGFGMRILSFLQDDWMDQAIKSFQELLPLNNFLNYTVDEYLGKGY